jgi:hypothetical protein
MTGSRRSSVMYACEVLDSETAQPVHSMSANRFGRWGDKLLEPSSGIAKAF